VAQGRLPGCPGPFQSATWTNCVGSHTFPNGGTYVGEFKDGKRNGPGTMTFPSGEKYAGEYRDGMRNGQGIEYSADGNVLRSGTWENNLFIGRQ
jgi:hypothetical protein